ncbi:hypothetical protein BH10PSE2_BH10PSE2_07510 [soil metagenome]
MAIVFAGLSASCAAEPTIAAEGSGSQWTKDETASETVVGVWSLAAAGAGHRCTIALLSEARRVNVEACTVSILSGSTSWAPVAGGFSLLAFDGHVIMSFRQIDVDSFQGVGVPYRLVRAAIS